MLIFPVVDSKNIALPPEDGIIFHTSTFCKRKTINRCKKFYENIVGKEGFHECPHGFTVYVRYHEKAQLIITSIKIEGKFNKKKLKNKLKGDFAPALPFDFFMKLLEYNFKCIDLYNQSSLSAVELKESSQFMKDTFHEIRKLNRDIKSQSEELNLTCYKQQDIDKEFLTYRIQNIYGTSSLISIRLDTFDLISNPLGVTATNPISIQIYKKFEKVKHCIDNKCKISKINIEFKGTSFSELKGYPIFEMLPYVLFENALKYSPENQTVEVEFDKIDDSETIRITNIGPKLDIEEVDYIFNKNFRGELASKNFQGTGIGLFFAKQVCDIHKIKIEAFIENKTLFTYNNIPYAYFVILLTLP